MTKRILIFAEGTRGDAQPIVALALALKKVGFHPCIATNKNHVSFIERLGVEALGTQFDLEAELTTNPEIREAMGKGEMIKMMKAHEKVMLREYKGDIANQIRALDEFKPDLVIGTPLNMFHIPALCSSRKIPVLQVGLQTFMPSVDQVSMMGEPSWGPHFAIGMFFMHLWNKAETSAKKPMLLELAPEVEEFLWQGLYEMSLDMFHPFAPNLIGCSPHISKPKDDYNEDAKKHVKCTGQWIIHSDMQVGKVDFGGSDMQKLSKFLSEGPPPVYIGWGSMIAVSESHMACLAVESLMRVKMRGIILKGWAGLKPELLEGHKNEAEMKAYISKNVLFVETAPHEWLFPKCSVTVHHGGAGTTAAALRSGRPTIITPVAFDQFSYAGIVADAGVGIKMAQLSTVTADKLSLSLAKACSDTEMNKKAEDMAAKLLKEDGAMEAAKAIQSFMEEEVETGEYYKKWTQRQKEKQKLRAAGPPSCFAWIGRICCSPNYTNFRIQL